MLDLIEHTNRDIVILMSMAFSLGFISAIVLCYMPVRTKLDTINRIADHNIRMMSRKDRNTDEVLVNRLRDNGLI